MFLNGEKRGECGFLGVSFEFEGLRVGAFLGLRVKLKFDNAGNWLLGASNHEPRIPKKNSPENFQRSCMFLDKMRSIYFLMILCLKVIPSFRIIFSK